MRRQYDDFTQLKLKDMSKYISDMTYNYINPETGEPTNVPAVHYEKILDEVAEQFVGVETNLKLLEVIYNQVLSIRKENEKYFNQALVCIDLGINPKDLRIKDQIAIQYINDYIEDKKIVEKKNYHFLSQDIIDTYEYAKNDPKIQASAINNSNLSDSRDENIFKKNEWER